MSYTITPEQNSEISKDLAFKIGRYVGTKICVQINYGTLSASIYGTLILADVEDSSWDYRLKHEDGNSESFFNVEDCYEVLHNTIFLGTR